MRDLRTRIDSSREEEMDEAGGRKDEKEGGEKADSRIANHKLQHQTRLFLVAFRRKSTRSPRSKVDLHGVTGLSIS